MLTLLTAAALSLPAVEGRTWQLTRLTPAGQAPITLSGKLTPPSLTLRGAAVTGSTGCSPLKGRVHLSPGRIHLTDLNAGSSDQCPDHALSLREDYLRLLKASTRYTLRGHTLTLRGPAGQLVFEPRP